MKRFFAFLALACAPLAWAVDPTPLAFKWDLTGTSYTFPRYCTFPHVASVMTCPGAGVAPIDGNGVSKKATTASASSTTVTSQNTNGVFANVGVGDLIIFNQPPIILSTGAIGGPQMRVVTAAASSDSITVDTAITIDTPGVSFRWWKFNQGAGAEDGWIAFPPHGNLTVNFPVDTLNATSLDYQVQCRACINDRCLSPWVAAGPTNIVAATPSQRVSIVNEAWNQCRVGMKLNTDTGVQSISIAFSPEQRP
jgi:hypothetical protein